MAIVSIGAKHYIMPVPVLILSSCDENGDSFAMLAVWGGTSHERKISVTAAIQRHTLCDILARVVFVFIMDDSDQKATCGYFGVVSGVKVQSKLANSGFHASRLASVDAPLINELPFAVECRLKSYDEASWRLVGESVSVILDERILVENDKVSFEKFHPLAFGWMNNIHRSLGAKAGNAYRDGLSRKDV